MKKPKAKQKLKQLTEKLKILNQLAQSLDKGPNHDYSLIEGMIAVTLFRKRQTLSEKIKKLSEFQFK